jgi:hypothetical protein
MNYLVNRPTLTIIVDLLIVDMPKNLHVLGLSTDISDWNRMGDFYTLVFKFASKTR